MILVNPKTYTLGCDALPSTLDYSHLLTEIAHKTPFQSAILMKMKKVSKFLFVDELNCLIIILFDVDFLDPPGNIFVPDALLMGSNVAVIDLMLDIVQKTQLINAEEIVV